MRPRVGRGAVRCELGEPGCISSDLAVLILTSSALCNLLGDSKAMLIPRSGDTWAHAPTVRRARAGKEHEVPAELNLTDL